MRDGGAPVVSGRLRAAIGRNLSRNVLLAKGSCDLAACCFASERTSHKSELQRRQVPCGKPWEERRRFIDVAPAQ